ncbi:hypothetical protein MMC10_010502 [Thelotrema lepadinum]|nr:hypothetical protein [Thelotrema lepadinum]
MSPSRYSIRMRVKSLVRQYEEKERPRREKRRSFPKGAARGMEGSSSKAESSEKVDTITSTPPAQDTPRDTPEKPARMRTVAKAHKKPLSSTTPFVPHPPRIHVTPPTIKSSVHDRLSKPESSSFTKSRRPSTSEGNPASPNTTTQTPPDNSTTMSTESPTSSTNASAEPPQSPALATKNALETTHVSQTTESPVTHEVLQPHIEHVTHRPVNHEIHEHHVLHRIQPVVDVEVLPARHFVVVDDQAGGVKKGAGDHQDSQESDKHIEIKGEGSRRQSLRDIQLPKVAELSGGEVIDEDGKKWSLREIPAEQLPRSSISDLTIREVSATILPGLSESAEHEQSRLQEFPTGQRRGFSGHEDQSQNSIHSRQPSAEQRVRGSGLSDHAQQQARLHEVYPKDLPGRLGTEGEVNELFARGREEAALSAVGQEKVRAMEGSGA